MYKYNSITNCHSDKKHYPTLLILGINFEEFLFLMSKTTAPGADKSGREQSSLIFQV